MFSDYDMERFRQQLLSAGLGEHVIIDLPPDCDIELLHKEDVEAFITRLQEATV